MRYLLPFLFFAFNLHSETILDSNQYCNKKSLQFSYANDLYHGTDRYLTQMTYLKYIGKWNEKGVRNEWTLQHHVYTPSDIFGDTIQRNDRPYSALFYGSIKRSKKLKWEHSLFHQQLSLGVQGTAAFGGPMQKQIHYWVDSRQPLGWDYQLKNALICNVQVAIEKGIITTQYFEYWLASTLNTGTVFNDISIKQQIRLHINHPYSIYNKPINRHRFRSSIELINELKFVSYNGTLQGNSFSHENIYRLKNSEIKRSVYFQNLAFTLGYKNLNICYAESFITKEFKTGFSHKWSSISFCYLF
jgi:lipid A 3-O-deacylase